MTKFFQQINYSASTEDGAAELAALRLTPQDRVVCVTGSGARTLDLLIDAPGEIHSLDFSAPQNYLLELKMAAYQFLSYDEFRHLMGLSDCSQIPTLLAQILPHLSQPARDYWHNHQTALARGALYCGTWEKLLRYMAWTTVLRRRHVRGLLAAPNLEAQREYWQRHWNVPFFRAYLKLLANRFLWVHLIREPGAKLIAPNFDVAGYLLNCLEKMASHSLLRENPYANLLFYGRYTDNCRLPLHLRVEHFETIRARLPCIQLHTASITDFLRTCGLKFQAFSLSDFSSYATAEQYADTWRAVVQSAEHGARYCERFFLVHHTPSEPGLVPDSELAARLLEIDHTCMYTFHAGTVT